MTSNNIDTVGVRALSSAETDAVAGGLNPQPLPPAFRFSWALLNPQPLPPRWSWAALTSSLFSFARLR